LENDVEVSGYGLIWGSILALYLEGLKETTQEPRFLHPVSEPRSGPGTSLKHSRGATQCTSLFTSTEHIFSKGRKVSDASQPLW